PLQSQTGEAGDKRDFGGEPGRKKSKKSFASLKKLPTFADPNGKRFRKRNKTPPESLEKTPDAAELCGPKRGPEKKQKKITGHGPRGTEKSISFASPSRKGHTAGDCCGRRGRRRKVL